jgi:protein-S-isoprenylcysteine O-methyltransferase Ste14
MFELEWFASAVQRNVYECAFLLFVGTEFFLLFLSGKNSRGQKEKSDRGSKPVIIFGFWLALFVGWIPFGHTLPAPFYYIGTVLLFAGTALRCWAVWTLGRFFTLSVQTKEEQKLIEAGPYRLIRHPAYTGSIMQLIGFPLGLRSWPGLIAAALIAALIYGYRIRTEEKALREHFGEKYEEYSRRTWRLFPFLY